MRDFSQRTDPFEVWWWILFGASLPWILIPVEVVLPWPYILEETAKILLVLQLYRSGLLSPLSAGGIGLAFGLSEMFLYGMNASEYGNFGVLIQRLMVTVPMHTATPVIFSYFLKKGWWPLGLLAAVVVHWGFNRLLLFF